MASTKRQVVSHLKKIRKASSLSQSELAELVGITRQAVGEMEAGRYVPNTELALVMAKELNCGVEDLFTLDDAEVGYPATLVEDTNDESPRVSVARVRDRTIAYPLDGRWLFREGFQAADGQMAFRHDRVELFREPDFLKRRILLLGCDPAFGILGAHASRWADEAKVLSRFASSHLALQRVADGNAHIAGMHLHSVSSGEANLMQAQKVLSGSKAMVVAFSVFEEGLMVAQGNPRCIRTVADLDKAEVKFVNREPGAALRILFDERLAQAGLRGECIHGYDFLVPSHDVGAQMVAFRLADAALGLRAVADAYGLDFVTMETVRCDLVVPCDLMDLPPVRILLDVLQSQHLRREIASLPGYESSCTGKVIGYA